MPPPSDTSSLPSPVSLRNGRWFGLLPRADVVVVMLSMQFFQSKACVKELVTAIELGKATPESRLDRLRVNGLREREPE